MYCSMFSSSENKGRKLYYPTQTAVSDNEITFKWLFRWRCFIIKRNILPEIWHSCCISNVWQSEVFVSHPLFDLKEVLFCCDFKLHFLIKSAKLIFILEFINHSNCRYKSIPRTRLGECCDFGGSVKQRKISIVYVWAIICLYNPLIKEWHIFMNRRTVGTV